MLKSGYAARPHPCGLNTRSLDAGYFTSIAGGLIGRGEKLPPQFGQRPSNRVSTQSRQNVHSNEQIIASVECGGSRLLQCSQVGRSSSMKPPAAVEGDRSASGSGERQAVTQLGVLAGAQSTVEARGVHVPPWRLPLDRGALAGLRKIAYGVP